MNEYLKIFQIITEFSDRLLADESKSLEIKQSATGLGVDVEACVKEIKESAGRLRELLQVCFKDVSQAEDVWNSKPRIAKASPIEIWNGIGELGGCDVRIRTLAQRGQQEAVIKVRKSWHEKSLKLKNKWFLWDKVQHSFQRDSIGFFEKDNLHKELRNEVDSQADRLILILENELNSIFQQLESIDTETIEFCIDCFDISSQYRYREQLQTIGGEIVSKFTEPLKYLPGTYMKGFKETLHAPVETLVHKSKLGINLQDFEESCQTIGSIMEDLIVSIFEERLNLAIQAVEKAMMFYNKFLERQARYQQETAQQREEEKAWIESQRQHLKQIEGRIDLILNQ
ncbi:MAG: hypothetical protein MUE44_16885 [Oscillatoriaceae cyanobacterium Prado104]|jgi:hypothetical protein|nr:hypothetical protein [Oscillatoriaceae cyanobacterium Prado104]